MCKQLNRTYLHRSAGCREARAAARQRSHFSVRLCHTSGCAKSDNEESAYELKRVPLCHCQNSYHNDRIQYKASLRTIPEP
eukprot:scaffold2691_cov417-Prasinococcus_capsulatus_cf.AAC.20